MRRAVLFSVLVLIGWIGATPASAHRSPIDCDANQLDVDLIRDKNLVKNGDVINYTVEVDNIGTRACDVSGITIEIQFPGPDGAPSSSKITVVNSASYAAQAPTTIFGPFAYTVNADPGVDRLEARVSVENGVLHDNDIHSVVNINKTIGTVIPKPGIEVDKTVNVKTGLAPADFVYTFRVYNRSVPPRPLSNVTLTDDKCPNVVGPLPGSDANGNGDLDPTEVWVYTCTQRHGVGVHTNTATACGELFLNGGPMPKVCDEDQETVEVTPPPPVPPPPPTPTPPTVVPDVVPEAGVRPASVTQAPCDIASPSGLRVRAKELTTVRVRVRNVDAGSVARITLPGGKVVRAKTNSSGVATFRIRPPKTGRATIRVAECADVERFTVRKARKVQTQRAPRVTG